MAVFLFAGEAKVLCAGLMAALEPKPNALMLEELSGSAGMRHAVGTGL